ncbi:MAG: aminotransferase class V-fold PLP-dependent enzyme [Candidatus Melainabacteria bacterium]|nr:aminotransferase class V-fold PLP-dependent enzyme [Candidatus Melainabacteria bacterium]
MREVYLDNGATSFPKPESVYQAIDHFIRRCGGSPGRGSHRKAREAEEIVAQSRSRLARLFGVRNAARIVFTSGCTESLNLSIKGVLKSGDHVITTDLEHNAMARTLWKLKKRLGIDICVVETSSEGCLDAGKIERAINARTRLICSVHANNVMGTILPISEIGKIARSKGVLLLVDAAQTAGVLPIDVEESQIDLLAFTGHKGLLGPPGTGGLYIREGIDVEPLKEGGTGIKSESLEHPHQVPEAYEAGTINAPGIAGLGAGAQFIEQESTAKIRSHELTLNQQFMESVATINRVRVYGPRDFNIKVAITLVSLDGLDPFEVGQLLDRKFGIMVRTGLQCSVWSHQKLGTEGKGAIRFSFGYFNTSEDVDYATYALQEIAKATYSVPVLSKA